MGKKGKSNALGRLLIKDRFGHSNAPRRTVDDTMLHTTEIQDGYDWGRLNLQSVTEESSFHDFLRTAELAGTEFQAEKLNMAYVVPRATVGVLSENQKLEINALHETKKDLLKIPRRPKWNSQMTAEDLQKAENEAFLNWRRGLALLQEDEGVIVTPYEKNLDFWRQLWRVVEKSDVIVQIVDARNPVLFRSVDLEKYVKEVDSSKMNMILINKSDLLTEEQRQAWATYFTEQEIQVVFFSATIEDEIPEEDQTNEANPPEKEESKSNVEVETKMSQVSLESNTLCNSSKLLSRSELIDTFKSIYKGVTKNENVTTIGLVGYPNVGKSSTINALMLEKKVSVSATPGKTKHFQTLFLETSLLLCDCPGLVMPSFVQTKADMVLNGILPIDQLRDHVPSVNLLCSRIPKHILEEKYGIVIAHDSDKQIKSEDLLLAYGYNRGYMTSNGQPDQSRSARYVLKDYVCGKLLYSLAPPSISQSEYHIFPERKKTQIAEDKLPKQQQRALRIEQKVNTTEFDTHFFGQHNGGVYVKGKSQSPYIHSGVNTNDGNTESVEKPWRKVKRDKKEKLRKKFVHLDQH